MCIHDDDAAEPSNDTTQLLRASKASRPLRGVLLKSQAATLAGRKQQEERWARCREGACE